MGIETSRTKNSTYNFFVSGLAQVVAVVIAFVGRRIFVSILNADYLGVNGLFSNVLSILSFSELGIGSAIIYSMYKPIRDGNSTKISALLGLYKRAYRVIAVVISLLGLAVIPFFDIIITGSVDIRENLIIIYLLFLFSTVSSYVFSYRKVLFSAYQKEYVIVLIERGVHILALCAQLVYLYYSHDFYGYLFFQIVQNLLTNLVIHILAKKKFTALVQYENQKLNSVERKDVFHNISSIFVYKIGSTVLTSTDNILISSIINLSIVGLYSNYSLIILTVEAILQKSLNSIVAGIGNLNASGDKENQYNVLNEIALIVYWIYGFCAIELYLLLDSCVSVWLGEQYIISQNAAVFAAVLTFYVLGTNFAASSYRLTMGFFIEGKFIPLLAAIINLILSVFLGKRYGLFGILIATSIARVLTFGIFDPIIVLKKGLGKSILPYYLRQLFFFVFTVGVGLVCFFAIRGIEAGGIVGLIVDALVIAVVCNAAFLVFLWNNKVFKSLIRRIMGSIRRKEMLG